MLWTIDVGWSAFYLTILGIILMLVLWKKRGTTKGGLLLGALNIIIACVSFYAILNFRAAYDSKTILLFVLVLIFASVLETIHGTVFYLKKPRKEKERKAKKERKWGSSKKEEKLNPLT